MIVSLIWNTSELSSSHLSRATDIFVVDGCQFGPSWIFGLKIGLMICAGLVGGTTEQSCLFPNRIWYYQWYETLLNFLHHTSGVPQPFLLLISANLALTGCLAENSAYGMCWLGWRYNGAKLYFSWSYMTVLILCNIPELSALHLSRATAIFVVDCCQFVPNWMFGQKMELMACAGLIGVTTEKRCLLPDLIC